VDASRVDLGDQLAGGIVRPGDEVLVLPGGQRTRVEAIEAFERELQVAFPPMSVTLRLADDIDISRGDMLVQPADLPTAARERPGDLDTIDG